MVAGSPSSAARSSAASRSPPTAPTTRRRPSSPIRRRPGRADDHGNSPQRQRVHIGPSRGEPTATPTTSATCVEDRDDDADDVVGDRQGVPDAPDDDAVSGDQHSGDDSGQHDERDATGPASLATTSDDG